MESFSFLERLTRPVHSPARSSYAGALMARRPVSKELWRQLQPLIPAFVPSAKGGARKRTVSDEAALNGILFVLHTGIAWEDLPQELGYGSGMTCWRRLRDWNAAGVWEKLHHTMLVRLREHDQIDWSRASIDGSSVPSPRGGQETGPNPTDRGKLGQAAHRRRRAGHSAGGAGQWCEPARFDDVREMHRCSASCQGTAGQTASQAIEAACRQGLRLRALPRLSEEAWHRQPHCQKRHREQ